MIKIELPTWQKCANKVRKDKPLTNLEQFVYEQEPANPYNKVWRKQLRKAIREIIEDYVTKHFLPPDKPTYFPPI